MRYLISLVATLLFGFSFVAPVQGQEVVTQRMNNSLTSWGVPSWDPFTGYQLPDTCQIWQDDGYADRVGVTQPDEWIIFQGYDDTLGIWLDLWVFEDLKDSVSFATSDTVTLSLEGLSSVRFIHGLAGQPGTNSVNANILAEFVAVVSLPVNLISFEVELNDQGLPELGWLTGSEVNNRGFHVIRSINGAAWEEIGFVVGAGTTSEWTSYAFVDETVPTEGGRVIYQLIQEDLDGTKTTSVLRDIMVAPTGNQDLDLFTLDGRRTDGGSSGVYLQHSEKTGFARLVGIIVH